MRKFLASLKSQNRVLVLSFLFIPYLGYRGLVATDWNRHSHEQFGFWSIPYLPFQGVSSDFGYWHNILYLIKGLLVEAIYFTESAILLFIILLLFLIISAIFSSIAH